MLSLNSSPPEQSNFCCRQIAFNGMDAIYASQLVLVKRIHLTLLQRQMHAGVSVLPAQKKNMTFSSSFGLAEAVIDKGLELEN
jgi:hypothetical protein